MFTIVTKDPCVSRTGGCDTGYNVDTHNAHYMITILKNVSESIVSGCLLGIDGENELV